MPSSSPNWDEIVNKMNSRKAKKANTVDSIGLAFLALAIFASLGGLSIMLLNMAFNRAWPSIEAFKPGIGYTDAVVLFWALWFFTIMKSTIVATVVRKTESNS